MPVMTKTRGAFVIIALAVPTAFFLSRSGAKPTIGSGPAGPAVPREPWSLVWRDAPVQLVGFGDSVTAGFGAPRGYGYFDRLASNPADEFPDLKGICLKSVFPRLEARNLSVSGSISEEHLERQIPKLEKARADMLGLVVITTGGNDLIHDYGRSPPREGAMYGATLDQARPWIASFENRLGVMIEKIQAGFPGGCHVFIADIFDPTDGVGDIENSGHSLPPWKDGLLILDQYNAAIRRAAGSHKDVHVVGVHDALLGHGIHCAERGRKHYRPEDPHYWYFDNLEDPNPRGYDAIRRLFLIEIAKVLAPR